jgi:protein gp37
MSADHWRQPYKWNRQAAATGKRWTVFPSMCDVFEEAPGLLDLQVRFWDLVNETPALTWLLLTKRPELAPPRVPRNVWVGATAENQYFADARWAHIRKCDSPVRFLSIEPMLGPVSMRAWPYRPHWIIVGCESGPRARPTSLDWVQRLRDECAHFRVRLFIKQLAIAGVFTKMPALDGKVWAEMPRGY